MDLAMLNANPLMARRQKTVFPGANLAGTEGQIGRENRDWSAEAALAFRHCDRNQDGFFVGAELDCAADATIARRLSIVRSLLVAIF
jgi:hypothetical protein